MPERLELAAPDQAKPGTLTYQPAAVLLNWESKFWELHLRGTNGELRIERISEAEGALTDMNAINKLTTPTVIRRLFNKLLSLGRLTATVSGTPD